jgi:hypothetical protein
MDLDLPLEPVSLPREIEAESRAASLCKSLNDLMPDETITERQNIHLSGGYITGKHRCPKSTVKSASKQ